MARRLYRSGEQGHGHPRDVYSGVSAAKAALSEVELAVQVGDYENATMAGVRAEYQSAYMHANMKVAAKAQAEKQHSKKNTSGRAAPDVP